MKLLVDPVIGSDPRVETLELAEFGAFMLMLAEAREQTNTGADRVAGMLSRRAIHRAHPEAVSHLPALERAGVCEILSDGGVQIIDYLCNEDGSTSSPWNQMSNEDTRAIQAKWRRDKDRKRRHAEGDHSLCHPRWCKGADQGRWKPAASTSRSTPSSTVESTVKDLDLERSGKSKSEAHASSAAGPGGPLATAAADHGGGQDSTTLIATVHGFKIETRPDAPGHTGITVEWPEDDVTPDPGGVRAAALARAILSDPEMEPFGRKNCKAQNCDHCLPFDTDSGWPLYSFMPTDHIGQAAFYLKRLLGEYATAEISDPDELEQ